MTTNFMKKSVVTLALGVAAASGAMTATSGTAHAQGTMVYVNGKPLQLAVSPVQQNGRLLVPMRAIFNELGAEVGYNDLTQAIVARRGTTTVTMALGSREAKVNGQRVLLDAPATAYAGRTMVPLRFVSEAMGATVDYNPAQRLVSIRNGNGEYAGNPGGYPDSGSQVGGYRQISIPADAVIPVTLDQKINSASAQVGQTFTATVVSQQLGDSEFPAGTKITGRVTEVQRRNGNEPGVLGLSFRNAVLPDGQRVPLRGELTSLDADAVSNQNGRLVATGKDKSNDTLKVVGIGAAGGFLIGKLLKKNSLVTGLLGAAGGYLYDRSKNNGKAREAVLQEGTRIGVRLDQSVSYKDTNGYYDRRSNFVRM